MGGWVGGCVCVCVFVCVCVCVCVNPTNLSVSTSPTCQVTHCGNHGNTFVVNICCL